MRLDGDVVGEGERVNLGENVVGLWRRGTLVGVSVERGL